MYFINPNLYVIISPPGEKCGLGDQWFLDEVFVKINGKQHYLWRAVDQDGCELDILLTKKRDKKSAIKFFRKLFKGQSLQPRKEP